MSNLFQNLQNTVSLFSQQDQRESIDFDEIKRKADIQEKKKYDIREQMRLRKIQYQFDQETSDFQHPQAGISDHPSQNPFLRNQSPQRPPIDAKPNLNHNPPNDQEQQIYNEASISMTEHNFQDYHTNLGDENQTHNSQFISEPKNQFNAEQQQRIGCDDIQQNARQVFQFSPSEPCQKSQRIKSLETTVTDLKAGNQNLEFQLQNLNEQMQKEKAVLYEEKQRLENEITELNKLVQEKFNSEDELKAKAQQMESDIRMEFQHKFRQAEERAKQVMSDNNDGFKTLRDQIDELNSQLSEAQKQIQAMDNDIYSRDSEIFIQKGNILNLQEEIENLRAQKTSVDSSASELQRLFAETQQQHEQSIKKCESLEQTISTNENNYQQQISSLIQQKDLSLKDFEVNKSKLSEELDLVRAQNQSLMEAQQQNEIRLNELLHQIEKLSEENQQLKKEYQNKQCLQQCSQTEEDERDGLIVELQTNFNQVQTKLIQMTKQNEEGEESQQNKIHDMNKAFSSQLLDLEGTSLKLKTKNWFSTALHLKVVSILNQKLSQKQNKCDQLNNQLETLTSQFNDQKISYEDQVQNIKEEMGSTERKLTKASQFMEIEKQKSHVKQVQFDQDFKNMTEKIGGLQKDTSHLQELNDDLMSKNQKLERVNQEMKQEINKKENEHQNQSFELNSRLSNLRSQLSIAEDQTKQLKSELLFKQTELKKVLDEKNQSLKTLQKLEQQLQSLLTKFNNDIRAKDETIGSLKQTISLSEASKERKTDFDLQIKNLQEDFDQKVRDLKYKQTDQMEFQIQKHAKEMKDYVNKTELRVSQLKKAQQLERKNHDERVKEAMNEFKRSYENQIEEINKENKDLKLKITQSSISEPKQENKIQQNQLQKAQQMPQQKLRTIQKSKIIVEREQVKEFSCTSESSQNSVGQKDEGELNEASNVLNTDQQSLQTFFISNTCSPGKSALKTLNNHETITLTNLSKEQIKKCDELIQKLANLQNQTPDLNNEEQIRIEIFKNFEMTSNYACNEFNISGLEEEKEITHKKQSGNLKQSIFSHLVSDKSKNEGKLWQDSLAYSIDDPAVNQNLMFECSQKHFELQNSEPERIEYTDSSFDRGFNEQQNQFNFDNLSLFEIDHKINEFNKKLELDQKIEEGIQEESPLIKDDQKLYDESRPVRKHYNLLTQRSIKEYKENMKLGIKDSPDENFYAHSLSKSIQIPAFSSNRDTDENKDSQDIKIEQFVTQHMGFEIEDSHSHDGISSNSQDSSPPTENDRQRQMMMEAIEDCHENDSLNQMIFEKQMIQQRINEIGNILKVNKQMEISPKEIDLQGQEGESSLMGSDFQINVGQGLISDDQKSKSIDQASGHRGKQALKQKFKLNLLHVNNTEFSDKGSYSNSDRQKMKKKKQEELEQQRQAYGRNDLFKQTSYRSPAKMILGPLSAYRPNSSRSLKNPNLKQASRHELSIEKSKSLQGSNNELQDEMELQKQQEFHKLYQQQIDQFKFKVRKDSKLETKIQEQIQKMSGVDGQRKQIPIVYLKEGRYMIGLKSCNVLLRGEQVIIKVGGGFENLSEWIDKNYEEVQRKIIQKMRQEELSLKGVIEIQAKLHKKLPTPMHKSSSPKPDQQKKSVNLLEVSSFELQF